jgi:ribosomal protein L29
LFLIAQSQNPRSIRQVKKKLADLRKVIKEVSARHKKVRGIKAQNSVLIAAAV